MCMCVCVCLHVCILDKKCNIMWYMRYMRYYAILCVLRDIMSYYAVLCVLPTSLTSLSLFGYELIIHGYWTRITWKRLSATCAGKHQWSKRTWKSSEFSLFSSTCCWKMTGGRLGKANWCPQKCKRAKKSVFCPCCYKRKYFSCSPCYFSYSHWHFSCLVYAWFMQWLPTIEDGKEK